ncbi:unnamed protein product [Gongylonema pulchrum]|uniref:DHH family phosphoesterase n=1 Tax=Gongylonema pulchrum TaxID=637853 RepID=A0A183E3C3_9BILA|nr:unnamed protein product [Gongylonema pulchrum]
MSEIILLDCHHDDALGSLIALLVFLENPPYGAAGQAEEMIEMDTNWHKRLELELIDKKEFYECCYDGKRKASSGRNSDQTRGRDASRHFCHPQEWD